MKNIFNILLVVALLLACTGSASGAILYLEDFDDVTSNGWGDRDAGEMTVSHNTVNDRMEGVFGASFLPMTDAFRIDTGLNFLGDYVTPGLTQISFDLVAVNVLPSDLFIRIIDGANTFTYQFNPINFSDTYVVNLAWSYGWNGLSEAAFNAALSSVDALEIQISRSGNSAQTFYLDNVETLDTDIGGGPIDTVIPEPATVSMFLIALGMIAGFRRYVLRDERHA